MPYLSFHLWQNQPRREAPPPANGYVAEDNTTFYVAEDGVTFYVQEV